jgi:hypothetical protein
MGKEIPEVDGAGEQDTTILNGYKSRREDDREQSCAAAQTIFGYTAKCAGVSVRTRCRHVYRKEKQRNEKKNNDKQGEKKKG